MEVTIEKRFCELFDKLVPATGKSDTLGGEIVRAVNRIIYRWYNDRDIAGEGYGNKTVNPATRFLEFVLSKVDSLEGFDEFKKAVVEITDIRDYGKPGGISALEKCYNKALDVLCEVTTRFVETNNLGDIPSDYDMFDWAEEGDMLKLFSDDDEED